MNPLFGLFLIGILLGAASGVAFENNVHRSRILEMRLSIEQANASSAKILAIANARIADLQHQAIINSQALDDANKKKLIASELYHSAISDRVRTVIEARCPDPMPPSHHPSVAKDKPAPAQFPERFSRFLADQARKADEVAIYAETCRRFVIDNNCGINRTD